MSMLGTKQPTYKDGRTKQSFKDETDINKLLERANKTGTISHLNKYEARYGDFTGFDFTESQIKLAEGETIFAALPAEIRNEFAQSPAQFFDFVNDPANADRLKQLLPALAAPGMQLPQMRGVLPADAPPIDALDETPIPAPNATPAPEASAPPAQPVVEALTPAEKAGSSSST